MSFFRSALLGGWLMLAAMMQAHAGSGAAPVEQSALYGTEEVTFPNAIDKLQLAGTLTVPQGTGPFPAVVLISDMGAQNRDGNVRGFQPLRLLAEHLSEQGIAVLRFDDRGVGKSEGDNNATTTLDRVKDVQAAMLYLRTRPEISAARVGLIGHGEGGNVGLLAAAQPMSPAYVVTLAASGQLGRELLTQQQAAQRMLSSADTSQTLGKRRLLAQQALEQQVASMRASGANAAQVETALAKYQLNQKTEAQNALAKALAREHAMLEIVRQNPDNAQVQAILANMMRQDNDQLDPGQARALAARRTTAWYRNYLNFDPQQYLSNVKCPVLLLQGLDDEEVAPANLTLLEKGLKANHAVTVQKFEGVNHLFQAPEAHWPVVENTPQPIFSYIALSTIREWVRQR
ncbi:alpha/beta hydrolase [Hymenobacter taeanensis]|uniref:Alpha/beta hydrolase n=1 Tax=Hymenobacter taeanensis TaxID=2735321 RepID=A0A6M6BES0_9BACT|nr:MULTISPECIES: alpha/beta hydrolase [Hymenobacter]QJX46469.1 alpha/beta hydrolase [Hymenobacter taeanensis]UOQ80332.1 alpha/beta fold hydrolase [Hymenobacter sp. 5414T-23]